MGWRHDVWRRATCPYCGGRATEEFAGKPGDATRLAWGRCEACAREWKRHVAAGAEFTVTSKEMASGERVPS